MVLASNFDRQWKTDSYFQRNFWFHDRSNFPTGLLDLLGTGHAEARLRDATQPIASHVRNDLDSYRIYHFHDTSSSAKVNKRATSMTTAGCNGRRQSGCVFYLLQQNHDGHFQNIEDTVRQIAPFFDGFQLRPSELNPDKIRLEWREKGSETYFNAHALSDGTLRFICLATLLLQPTMPAVILLDEPELGLHPAAISLLAALLESAAQKTQVLVATQSVTLINQFTPEFVWIVERENRASVFKHLESADMSAWLENYSLGELWEKNIWAETVTCKSVDFGRGPNRRAVCQKLLQPHLLAFGVHAEPKIVTTKRVKSRARTSRAE